MNKINKKIYTALSAVSIQLKIYGMVFLVILLVTSISLFVIRISIQNTLTAQIEDRAKSISSDISSRSVDLILTNNIYGMQSLISDTLNSYHDIEYIFILNDKGELIVQSKPNMPISEELKTANKPIIKNSNDEVNHTKKINSEKGIILDSASPILQGGTVRVGLNYSSLYDALDKITNQLIFSMIGLLIISALIVFGLTKILTYPINQLVHLTNEVSKGKLSQRIHSSADDEIGKLTKSFNKMLDSLQKVEKEKEEYIEQIKNRNKELSLLNNLSKNLTNVNQLRDMLSKFASELVELLNLNSAYIEVEIEGQTEVFFDRKAFCRNLYENQNVCAQGSCIKGEVNYIHNIPLKMNNGKIIGRISICCVNELGNTFINILSSLANQLAVSVENLQLWNEIKKKEEIRLMLLEKLIHAQEDERKRIARELHDETSHSLSSMLVELKMLQEGSEKRKIEAIGNLRKLVQVAIEEVHQLAWQLRPNILDKFGLKVAIERYVEEFKKVNNVEVDLVISGELGVLKQETETAIFRLIQESLTNISKYAGATFVSIILISVENQVSIVIEDDGIGFDVKEVLERDPSKEHLGLLGMHERISILDGTLDIESEPKKGTTILAKIPHVRRGDN
ncbi:histidine kinase [Cytobacillus sp. Hz8]|uniref:sensor histidine kinase n=1 Tax=Cytobacillus sp. Hz8 TaxID=3347168 RepID=UPI0035DB639B